VRQKESGCRKTKKSSRKPQRCLRFLVADLTGEVEPPLVQKRLYCVMESGRVSSAYDLPYRWMTRMTRCCRLSGIILSSGFFVPLIFYSTEIGFRKIPQASNVGGS